ncbi:thiol reductant ABC exporter subunit CydD [Brevundimonas sp.]|uniref:thiol reductant ABC exporter subunit CydD n=1 Tax=Brevundimonas sp. TaxID=1871086 RepID=UPI0022C02A2F|nr:thiol reductant ABC exporter subunit CydD [Brevundimonas sp.]MCZ8193833.1 thiol reductant ABC exporter subunit CydD [Brevundimonas sp.]
MSAPSLNVPPDLRLARAWLNTAAGPRRGPNRRALTRAGALVVADTVPAVVFALGLAWALAAWTGGVEAILPGAGMALGALLLRGLLARAAVAAGARAAAGVKRELRGRAVAGLLSGRPAALTAAAEGVEAVDGHYARFEPARLAAAVSPLILIAVVALASPVAAGILLFTLISFILGMALAGVAAAGESRRQFEALARLSGLFLDRVRALPPILAFRAEARMARDVARAAGELSSRTGKVLRIAFVSSAIIEFFAALSVALVAVYCGFNLLRLLPFPVPETLDLGRAFFALALAPEVYAPLRRLAAAYHDRQAAEAAVPTLSTALPDESAPAAAAPAFTDLTRARPPAIRFAQVAIAYGDAPPVISGFDLDIRPGQIIALTGASGAGKSSVLHTLLGLAPVVSGHILIDDRPLSVNAGLAGVAAWAGQAPVVLPGTLADNILAADRSATRRRVMAAAAGAGLHGDLDRPLDERGGGLSGGEIRRLGLARALLKPAPILLLDEPTANLDRESEAALIETLRHAAEGRTTLIATHSAAVAAMADRVVRL